MNVDEKLELYTELIKNHAQVALKKVKKPTSYTLNDLFQEGVLVFLRSNDSFLENRGACFKTFLTKCLRNSFASLVKRTYRKKEKYCTSSRISIQDQTFFAEEVDFMTKKRTADTFDIVQVLFLIDSLSRVELQYVNTILSFAHIHRRSRRKAAREALRMSYDREKELRRSLKDKIKK